MQRTNQLTYSEQKKISKKRNFNRTVLGLMAIVGVVTLGDLTVKHKIISNLKENISAYLTKRDNDLNQQDYMKLRNYVMGEELINPLLNQGWDFYAEKLLDKYPCENIASVDKWSKFLKTYNGEKEPTKGIMIRFPKLKCD